MAILILVFLVKPKEKRKAELNTKPTDYVPTSELIRRTEENIASTRALLDETRAKEGKEIINQRDKSASDSGGYEEYEITGVHIPSRKNYVLNFCSEYDGLELRHEKNNKFSDRAIAVKHDGKKIGYIAESEVEEIHKIIMNTFKAYIVEIDYDGSCLTVQLAIEYKRTAKKPAGNTV